MNEIQNQIEEFAGEASATEELGCAEPRRRILIVEGDAGSTQALAFGLRSAGYETMARDAANGEATARKTAPDLVVLDLSRLGEEGFGLAERIQKLIGWCVPTIFLTARKEPRFEQQAEAFEAAGFFESPYEPVDVVTAINLALNGKDHPAGSDEPQEAGDSPARQGWWSAVID